MSPTDREALLAEIREREQAATPGPWDWYGNTDCQEISLATRGLGRSYVMRFARWGMRNAKPVFAVGRQWGPHPDHGELEIHPHGTLTGADALAVYEVCPSATDRGDARVYRGDLTAIRHPDAEFIARAREDIPRLLAIVGELQHELRAATLTTAGDRP